MRKLCTMKRQEKQNNMSLYPAWRLSEKLK